MATTNQPTVDSLAVHALNAERQIEEQLNKAFNLNVLGVIEDSGACLETIQTIAHLNKAMRIIAAFSTTVLNRCNGSATLDDVTTTE